MLLPRSAFLLTLLLSACDGEKPSPETEPLTTDADADGYGADEDCDDGNAAVNPGAAEECDELDNNCDGAVDEGVTATFYVDADGDGYGGDDSATEGCDQPEGAVAEGGDCNDTDTDYHPGAEEDDCTDTNDYNCDGSTGYADADSDGVAACEDCDDSDPAILPSAQEVCDGVDNDCDAAIDAQDDDVEGASVWYTDSDGDGFGDEDGAILACDQPTGTVEDDTDCDDEDAAINPGAEEECGGEDEDCDGQVNEDGASGSVTVYRDVDNDGYGDAGSPRETCGLPGGYVEDSSDCDDGDKDVNPGETEVCNTIDDDCDADIDEDSAADAGKWYLDADSDGFGTPDTSDLACDQPAGYVSSSLDCDDADADVSPSGTEDPYDGIDQDCKDGDLTDVDDDGFDAVEAAGDDCDDEEPAIYPGALEVCDGLDNDCDEEIDDVGALTWFADLDGDGYGAAGDSLASEGCDQPDGYVSDATDCDDDDPDAYPGASEIVSDGIDQDCDGSDTGSTVEYGWLPSWTGLYGYSSPLQYILTDVDVPTSLTITHLGTAVENSGGGRFHIALYEDNGSGSAGTLLAAVYDVVLATGENRVELDTPVTVGAGTYWVGIVNESGYSNGYIASTGMICLSYGVTFSNALYDPFPATCSSFPVQVVMWVVGY